MNNKNKQKGFTLIELLVVIAIIGMLSSVVLASMNTARKKARDARRMADAKSLQTALELFYDTGNRYPVYNGVISDESPLKTALVKEYVSRLPKDPINSAPFQYTYCADAATAAYGYAIVIKKEMSGATCKFQEGEGCASVTTANTPFCTQ